MAYCTSCGRETEWTSKSGCCLECARAVLKVREEQAKTAKSIASLPEKVSDKRWSYAFWLCLLLGFWGAHRFYVGKKGTGVIWILTFGCGGFGVLIDLIAICSSSFTDINGAFVLTERKRLLAKEIAKRKEDELNRSKIFEEQARQATIDEQRTARAEWLESHGEITLNVAGVTFDTQSGKSRQRLLKALHAAQSIGEGPDVKLLKYEYNGAAAIGVIVNDEDIGSIRKSDLPEVLPILDKDHDVTLWVEQFEAPDEYTGKMKKLYRAEVYIKWAK